MTFNVMPSARWSVWRRTDAVFTNRQLPATVPATPRGDVRGDTAARRG